MPSRFQGGIKKPNGRRAFEVYVDESDLEALASKATKQGKSVSELVRTYITWGLENDE